MTIAVDWDVKQQTKTNKNIMNKYEVSFQFKDRMARIVDNNEMTNVTVVCM